MGSPQAHQATIDMTLTFQQLQPQLQPEWCQELMFSGECYGLCIVAYLTLDSAEMGLAPSAMTTPGTKRHINFSRWLLD